MKLYYSKPEGENYDANVVAYFRYHADNLDSISMQQKGIYNYCKEHNLFLEAEYIDIGYSGNDPNRPGLQQLLFDADCHPTWSQVILFDMSRLSRNISQAIDFESQLKKSGIKIVNINDKFSNTNEQEILKNMINDILQYYDQMQIDNSTGFPVAVVNMA